MGDRWGAEGPPAEAYGRVTDPLRYRPLHALGREVLDDLERRFEVTRETTTEPDPRGDTPAPAVRLVPSDPAASTVTFVFDAFPGLTVRFGRGDQLHLPICGCDACDETLEDCARELREHLHAITAGTFGERLARDHGWSLERWYRAENCEWSRRRPVRRAERKALASVITPTWAPWPERVS